MDELNPQSNDIQETTGGTRHKALGRNALDDEDSHRVLVQAHVNK